MVNNREIPISSVKMFLAIIAIIALYLIILAIKRYRFLSHLKQFKRPKGLLFFGNALDFIDPKNSLITPIKYYKECGNNFLVFLGPEMFIAATEPELFECILGSNKLIDKSDEYKLAHRWFGTGTGKKWKSHRKIITPSFHYKILEDFVNVFDKASRKLVSKLNNELGNNSFDIFNYVTLCTLDIICETAMGTTINAQDYPESDFVKSTQTMCDVLYTRAFSPILRKDFFYYFSKTYQREKKTLKIIHGHTNSVIKERKQALQNNDIEELNEFGVKSKNSFLDALLKCSIDGVALTDEELREEVDTFMFEGHDTTAVSISFTLYLLSKHLDVQQKVYEEIQLLIGNDLNKSATIEILQQMKYLEMVIKESLRLYPSVAAYGRELCEDTPFNGGILPKGIRVVILDYLLHRNPDHFPDPEKFDPERFSFENCTKRHPYAYVPFSAGPRNCIGQKFAMLELKSTISKVLRCFKVMPAIPEHNICVVSQVTIQSTNGIKIRLQPRL